MKKLLILTLLFSCLNAHALIINSDVTKLGEQQYQADYQFFNDSQNAIDGLTVYFQYGVFDNIGLLFSPADWDVFVAPAQSIFGLEEDGFVDALALASPLQAGETLTGLSVVFDWTNNAELISTTQRFETYDANSFDITSEGEYQLSTTRAVSAPMSALFFIALVCVMGRFIRRQGKSHFAGNLGGNHHRVGEGVTA
ncbi:hypothetical protein Patl_1068 [Paraglaciecola sp. T6c]|uniref:hypothetical protein n=1 Tax=Pseudoalteromonas atlantica (strain T6c / ATCC BAA-1087) TaxID=3042615 RepID=UPI00005C5A33|nr:hypothetical protein [Paraglaciecola sp. T6c]ABG39594.1 hypothetical protein Patl_1068 [Paraglaciecola sp. T6c]